MYKKPDRFQIGPDINANILININGSVRWNNSPPSSPAPSAGRDPSIQYGGRRCSTYLTLIFLSFAAIIKFLFAAIFARNETQKAISYLTAFEVTASQFHDSFQILIRSVQNYVDISSACWAGSKGVRGTMREVDFVEVEQKRTLSIKHLNQFSLH